MSRSRRAPRSRNLRVLVDMDGVLCDFEQELLDRYRLRYPEERFIPLCERDGFYVNTQYSLIRPDLGDKISDLIDEEGFFGALPPIEGALDAIREMSRIPGVDVFICTSPLTSTLHSVKEKFEWVERHLGIGWISRTVISRDKTIVSGDLLIDDRPKIKGVERSPSWEHILFTACHNIRLDISGSSCVRRLNNWTDGSWHQLITDYQRRLS